jgi:hypothetical protein
MMSFKKQPDNDTQQASGKITSRLKQWPIQLHLISPKASREKSCRKNGFNRLFEPDLKSNVHAIPPAAKKVISQPPISGVRSRCYSFLQRRQGDLVRGLRSQQQSRQHGIQGAKLVERQRHQRLDQRDPFPWV